MPKKTNSIYQFHINLSESSPIIWRQIQVPEDFTFGDLHLAIQRAMGWMDCHLHQFTIKDPNTKEKITIGLPDPDWDDPLPDVWEKSIKDYFMIENSSAKYLYDFGDEWEHNIVLEKIAKSEKDVKYPRCTAGQHAGPPEDCGGIIRYNYILDVFNNQKKAKKDDEENLKDFLEWLGDDDFDPAKFSCDSVEF